MQDKLQTRLEALRTEFTKGQEQLTELEQQVEQTRTAMLRISGAIQVLEEMLNETTKESHNPVVGQNGEG